MGPTKQEREGHDRDHIPFRTWCAHCMRGKAKTSHSRAGSTDDVKDKPVISMDYAFLGVSRTGRKELEEHEKEAEAAGHTPCIIVHDSRGKGMLACAVNNKGADDAA